MKVKQIDIVDGQEIGQTHGHQYYKTTFVEDEHKAFIMSHGHGLHNVVKILKQMGHDCSAVDHRKDAEEKK